MSKPILSRSLAPLAGTSVPRRGRGVGGEAKAFQTSHVPPSPIGCLTGGSPKLNFAEGSPDLTSPGIARRQVPFFASPKKGTKERGPASREQGSRLRDVTVRESGPDAGIAGLHPPPGSDPHYVGPLFHPPASLHLRWPSASLSRQAQAGQCGNSRRFDFEGSEAQTSALLCQVEFSTGLHLSSAAASEGGVQNQRQSRNRTPGLPRPCRPRNDRGTALATWSLRGGRADEAIQCQSAPTPFPSPRLRGEGGPEGRVRGKVWHLTPPLCRRGRRAELGAFEASLSEHVAAQMIFLGRSCEFASRPIQPSGRGLPRRAAQRGALSLVTSFEQAKKVTRRRAAPANHRVRSTSIRHD